VFFPSAEVEVKIVPSIALAAGGLRSCFGCDLLFSCQHCNKVGSQLLPPSSENACSKRCESGVMSTKQFGRGWLCH